MSPKSKVRSSKSSTSKHSRKTRTLPFVFANFAMTADGKTAFADHRFKPFTSKRDLEHMMELRATADAVMSGARTLDLTTATLGTGGKKYRRQRLRRGLREHNLRVIVSGSCSIDLDAEIFKHRSSPILILTTQRAPASTRRRLQALGAIVKICGKTKLNFRAAFCWLRTKWDVKRLLCEGGGELNGALVRAGLLDELHLTISPKIFGGRTSPTIADGAGFRKLAQATQFEISSSRRIADELFLVFRRRK